MAAAVAFNFISSNLNASESSPCLFNQDPILQESNLTPVASPEYISSEHHPLSDVTTDDIEVKFAFFAFFLDLLQVFDIRVRFYSRTKLAFFRGWNLDLVEFQELQSI